MIPTFEFVLPTTIEFGVGVTSNIIHALDQERAKTVMVVSDKTLCDLGMIDPIVNMLKENKITYYVWNDIRPNPLSTQVTACGRMCREKFVDAIIAVGGGSSMDCAKGAALIATNGGDITDYLELRGAYKQSIEKPLLPLIAVPTTSGTGSEVTECMVIVDTLDRKDIVYDTRVAPKYAFVDPAMTFNCPRNVTANTGLDVLGHALEAYCSRLENKIADQLGLEAIKLVFKWLPRAVEGDEEARIHMSLASMYAGIAQSKNSCILPHAISNPLSAHHGIPHGLGVGVAQVPTIELLKDTIPWKYKEVMDYIEGGSVDEADSANRLIEKIRKLLADCGIPEKLHISDITEAQLESYAEEDLLDLTDLDPCPKQPVTYDNLLDIYHQIIEL